MNPLNKNIRVVCSNVYSATSIIRTFRTLTKVPFLYGCIVELHPNTSDPNPSVNQCNSISYSPFTNISTMSRSSLIVQFSNCPLRTLLHTGEHLERTHCSYFILQSGSLIMNTQRTKKCVHNKETSY